MAEQFTIKQNDTSPAIQGTLTTAASLIGATATFSMKNSAGAVAINKAAAVISDVTNKVVQYQWTALNTAIAGEFEAEFELTYADGRVETFPNTDDYIQVTIYDDIA
jgi:hypothetical protein